MARQKQKTDDKRQRILLAAIKVFSKNGFHGSKVSDIAKDAGVADGTIYLYFKNKDDILIQLFDESLKVMLENMRKALAKEKNPLERIKIFIQMHLASVMQYQSVAEVMQLELRQSHKFMREDVPRRWGEYLNIISETVRQGQESGMIRKDVHPAMIRAAVFGAMDEIALNWVLSKYRKKKTFDLKESADKLAGVFLEGLLTPEQRARLVDN